MSASPSESADAAADSAPKTEEETPCAYLCAITQDIMIDPVMDPEGNTYERTAIEEWLTNNQVSPLTRTPLMDSQLIPNRALKDAIEDYLRSKGLPVPSAVVAAKNMISAPKDLDTGVCLSLSGSKTFKDGSDGVLIQTTISGCKGKSRVPTDVVCVVDTSGSMCSMAGVKSTTGEVEQTNLSLLDITKHAVATIIEVLKPFDRLALVSFSTVAKVEFALTYMDADGKKLAKEKLKALKTGGCTNLWDGLKKGLDTAQNRSAENSTRNSAVFLLTDGCPSEIPPRGHLEMLKRYKAKNTADMPTVSTFGFGYSLDSALLFAIASMCHGMYTFIPDSGFVGTGFVHCISNLLVNYAKNLSLKLETKDGFQIKKVLSDWYTEIPLVTETGSGSRATFVSPPANIISSCATLQVGNLQYGQDKHILIHVVRDGDSTSSPEEGEVVISATLAHNVIENSEVQVAHVDNWTWTEDVQGSDVIEHAYARSMFSATAMNVLGEFKDEKKQIVENCIQTLQKLPGQGEALQSLLADLKGQVSEAVSKEFFFTRWGCHYLPSLCRAHQLQQCNNFKDPGIQAYGGEIFNDIRDIADDLFMNIPPPIPSRGTSSFSGGGGGGGGAPIDMSRYNSRSGPCFHGECLVKMANGKSTRVDALRKGDLVLNSTGGGSEVVCVVKTLCREGKTELVRLPGGLKITAYHPLRLKRRDDWAFPYEVANAQELPCEAVYSFVLKEEHIMMINGVDCITLAHGVENDRVLTHPYFGTDMILKDLARLSPEGWEEGLITFMPECMIRSEDTGLLVGFDPDCLVQTQEEVCTRMPMPVV